MASDDFTRRKKNKEEQKMKVKSTKKCAAKPAVPAKVTKCCCAEKKSVAKAEKKSVTFTVHAEKGKTVCLAGEFNQWDPTSIKMAYKAKDGVYATTIKLDVGTYQYKFVIDGTWCADPENVNSVANDQGTFNSVITIK